MCIRDSIGAVIDIKFTDGNLPEINSAINIKTNDGGKLVVEVAQHLGDDVVFLAAAVAILIWVILNKTTFGYELKAVGLNKRAARYAGINEKKNIILSICLLYTSRCV